MQDLAKRRSLGKRILESANAFIVASSAGIVERARDRCERIHALGQQSISFSPRRQC